LRVNLDCFKGGLTPRIWLKVATPQTHPGKHSGRARTGSKLQESRDLDTKSIKTRVWECSSTSGFSVLLRYVHIDTFKSGPLCHSRLKQSYKFVTLIAHSLTLSPAASPRTSRESANRAKGHERPREAARGRERCREGARGRVPREYPARCVRLFYAGSRQLSV
jgi:hypothetical protein